MLPLSNPTSSSEARPEDILAWTAGRALVATGSPSDPVVYDGRRIVIGLANNVFIFPGVGLGALVAEASEVTESMFVAAADRLANEVPPEALANGTVFPAIPRIRQVTARIAEASCARVRGRRGRSPLDEE